MERSEKMPHVLHGSVPTGLQNKPDLMALPFTGKNEKLLLIVFGHYNIHLRTEFADFVANTKKSRV